MVVTLRIRGERKLSPFNIWRNSEQIVQVPGSAAAREWVPARNDRLGATNQTGRDCRAEKGHIRRNSESFNLYVGGPHYLGCADWIGSKRKNGTMPRSKWHVYGKSMRRFVSFSEGNSTVKRRGKAEP